jgi:hypothetical protein
MADLQEITLQLRNGADIALDPSSLVEAISTCLPALRPAAAGT